MKAIAGRAVLLTALAMLALPACGRDTVDPCAPLPGSGDEIMVISPPSLQLTPGGRGTMTALVTGGYRGKCSKLVGWRSTDTTVARVAADTWNAATVSGVAQGSASIIATLLVNPLHAAAAVVIVSAPK